MVNVRDVRISVRAKDHAWSDSVYTPMSIERTRHANKRTYSHMAIAIDTHMFRYSTGVTDTQSNSLEKHYMGLHLINLVYNKRYLQNKYFTTHSIGIVS